MTARQLDPDMGGVGRAARLVPSAPRNSRTMVHNGQIIDAFWRACGYCGGHHMGHNSGSMGGVFLCKPHLAALFSAFDPQPNDTVRYIDGSQRTYVVLARDGEVLTLRPLGSPDDLSHEASVHNLWPGPGAVHEVIARGLKMRPAVAPPAPDEGTRQEGLINVEE